MVHEQAIRAGYTGRCSHMERRSGALWVGRQGGGAGGGAAERGRGPRQVGCAVVRG